MQTRKINLYNFRELNELASNGNDVAKKAAAKILERETQAAAECFDADYLLEDFAERINKDYKISGKDAIHYSGFYSQGDGLCFDFYFVRDVALENKQLKELIDTGAVEVTFTSETNGFASHYSHDRTRQVKAIDVEFKDADAGGQFEIQKMIDSETETQAVRYHDLCVSMYNELKDAFESETSEDVVKEGLMENEENLYTVDGKSLSEYSLEPEGKE